MPEVWGQKQLLDLTAKAKDAKGNQAQTMVSLTSEPFGENVLLRLDKAIYKGGEAIKVKIHTSAGLPTVYLDVVRGGQTLLTQWLDVKDGLAEQTLELPPSVFGTLEVHAYQMLGHGEIIRDSRVVYVNPASDLKIEIKADKDVYQPGEKGSLTFQVRDAKGKPTAAALGVLIVDEAVYALQEMQPGLEKVYFTLQEELLKPQAHILYKPSEGIDTLVREPALAADKQQIAEVLMTAIKPSIPAHWEVNPDIERQLKVQQILPHIGNALFGWAAQNNPCVEFDKETKTWQFTSAMMTGAWKTYGWNENTFTDPFGGKLTPASLAHLSSHCTPESLARAVTQYRQHHLHGALAQLAQGHAGEWRKDRKWTLPADVLDRARKLNNYPETWTTDGWGNKFQLIKRDGKVDQALFDSYELVSAGPDGKVDTADDLKVTAAKNWLFGQGWWLSDKERAAQLVPMNGRGAGMGRDVHAGRRRRSRRYRRSLPPSRRISRKQGR